jgi:hypothetical protein
MRKFSIYDEEKNLLDEREKCEYLSKAFLSQRVDFYRFQKPCQPNIMYCSPLQQMHQISRLPKIRFQLHPTQQHSVQVL